MPRKRSSTLTFSAAINFLCVAHQPLQNCRGNMKALLSHLHRLILLDSRDVGANWNVPNPFPMHVRVRHRGNGVLCRVLTTW